MILGCSVTKSTTWRGIEEEFSNVYHFDAAVDTTSQQVADAVVGAERTILGTNVSMKNVKVWGPTDGTKEQSVMLLQQNLTGTGAIIAGSVCAKELSAVLQWDTGRKNTRGGTIFLRKYLHVGAIPDTAEEAAKGNAALPAAAITRFNNFGNSVKNPVGVNGAPLCDKKGRKLPLNTPTKTLTHLHTRQFRR
jgi:hypothetical protein